MDNKELAAIIWGAVNDQVLDIPSSSYLKLNTPQTVELIASLLDKDKQWRCYFCDEVFTTKEAAFHHFGPDDHEEQDVPACIDPLRTDEKERMDALKDAQRYALQCQTEAGEADERLMRSEQDLHDFKFLTKCSSIHELRMSMDSQQGELITARELIKAIKEKAPQVYADLIK